MFSAKTLAQRVLLARRDLQWDQDELSRKSGISRGYISEIERLRKTNVGIEVVFALADALGVTVPYLLGLTDNAVGEPIDQLQADNYMVVEVKSPEQRRALQQVVDEYSALSANQQRFALNMLRMMRQAEEEENAPLSPRIVE
jgi:transcriptional regulator with XRE-family HTH domain